MADIKIGPLEDIIGEEVIGYKETPMDAKTNANIVLSFKSGKKLFISSVALKEPLGSSILHLSSVDYNATIQE